MPLVGEVPSPPPAKRATRSTAASSTTKKLVDDTPSKAAERAENLMAFAGIAQGIVMMAGNFADVETIDMHARPFLTAVAKLGDVHPEFGGGLDKSDKFAPYIAVFAAGFPMALQFMANHGRIDPSRLRVGGIQNPDVLANRATSKIMDAQTELIREQREAAEAAMRATQRRNEEVAAFNALADQMNGQAQPSHV